MRNESIKKTLKKALFKYFELKYDHNIMFSHPSSVCMTYVEHCKFSLEMAGVFSYAAFTAVVHAFLPDYFVDSTTRSIEYIKKRLDESGCRKTK